jgi:DNA mismatch endonuclease (patch repair protein)
MVAAMRRMQRVRQRDNPFELSVRRLLFKERYRYRVHYKPLKNLNRHADVAFPRKKVAVFFDGCFWHGCPDHGTIPKTNTVWWRAKIERNMARDQETNHLLSTAGWSVIRIWEHTAPTEACATIKKKLYERR